MNSISKTKICIYINDETIKLLDLKIAGNKAQFKNRSMIFEKLAIEFLESNNYDIKTSNNYDIITSNNYDIITSNNNLATHELKASTPKNNYLNL